MENNGLGVGIGRIVYTPVWLSDNVRLFNVLCIDITQQTFITPYCPKKGEFEIFFNFLEFNLRFEKKLKCI